jgi:hypothetical protein
MLASNALLPPSYGSFHAVSTVLVSCVTSWLSRSLLYLRQVDPHDGTAFGCGPCLPFPIIQMSGPCQVLWVSSLWQRYAHQGPTTKSTVWEGGVILTKDEGRFCCYPSFGLTSERLSVTSGTVWYLMNHLP